MTIKLPVNIYQGKRSKKKVMLSLNKAIGLNPFAWNALKNNYKETIMGLLPKDIKKIDGKFKTTWIYYYKDPRGDLSNVVPVISKIVLDLFQEIDLIENDNIKYHIKDISIVGSKVDEPYIELIIEGVK
jgi:hypothetical protein